MSRFVVSKRADQDLDGIADYIAQHNPSAAVRELRRLYDKFALLATQPLLGESRDDLGLDLRGFAAGSYVIFYRPTEDGIEIVGVVHGARNIPATFREE